MKPLFAFLILCLAVPSSVLAQVESSTDQTEFSFVVIGHPRGGSDNEPFYQLDELVHQVAQLEPDLVVITGDMIFGDWFEPGADRGRITEHWDRFDAAWDELGVPIYRVPENHDINGPVTRDIYI